MLVKWLVTLELGWKAQCVSKELDRVCAGRRKASAKRAPGIFLTSVLHAVK